MEFQEPLALATMLGRLQPLFSLTVVFFFHCFYFLVSDQLMHDVVTDRCMCYVAQSIRRTQSLTLIFESTLIHTGNLKIERNKLSYTRHMCQDLVLEETSCLSIRITEHLPLAITKSLYFGWLLMGGLTVLRPCQGKFYGPKSSDNA